MQNALQLLDEAKVAAHIGAHLDLAICRLQDEIAANTATPSRETIDNVHQNAGARA
jgi:hypothetical protein